MRCAAVAIPGVIAALGIALSPNALGRQLVTINVDDEHQFWPFTGEYWRDELGYYRYRLANKCGRTGIPEGSPRPTAAAAEEQAMDGRVSQ